MSLSARDQFTRSQSAGVLQYVDRIDPVLLKTWRSGQKFSEYPAVRENSPEIPEFQRLAESAIGSVRVRVAFRSRRVVLWPSSVGTAAGDRQGIGL